MYRIVLRDFDSGTDIVCYVNPVNRSAGSIYDCE